MKKMMHKQQVMAKPQQGVVLIEALIAILIFSFGILAISGLQAAMIKNTSEANYRSEASYIVQQQLGRMWADPSPASLTAFVGTTNLSARLPGGQLVITRTSGNYFKFVVSWQQPGGDAHNYTANASVDAN